MVAELGGTDSEKLPIFKEMMDDDNISAIWCVRGGYGTVRIIDSLDFTKFKSIRNGLWVSDVTVLVN